MKLVGLDLSFRTILYIIIIISFIVLIIYRWNKSSKKEKILRITLIMLFLLVISIENINFVDILSRPKPMEEIVQEEYFEKSYKNEFDSLFVLNYRDPIHTNISTSDYKIIEELLDELYKLELDKTERTGSYGIELWFRNEQGERMMVHIMKDGNIAIGTKTYDYIKDEENKVIKHEYSDSERKYYKITSGDLDIEDIQKIIDKIE
jgi:amino acid transporter